MNRKEIEDRIIENYRQDENMMVLVFAQWCINHDLDPVVIYHKAYPDQINNPILNQAINLTVSKEESEEISFETIISVLSLFGNEDLAFVVSEEFNRLRLKSK